MEEDELVEEPPARGLRAGERLRAARQEAGLELEQVAAETRIPQRHLATVEAGDYGRLPSRTYAIGFTRTYARMLGLDERELTGQVRAELADGDADARAAPDKFEPGDPARVPSRKLAWVSALAVVLLLVGGFSFYRTYFSPGLGPAPLVAENEQVAQAEQRGARTRPAQAAAQPSGPVVFTATAGEVWVRFSDASGERLYEAIMNEGDSYTVPAEAEEPQIWTGRPHELRITIGGREVPRLAEEQTTLKNVPVTAEALLARAEDEAASAQQAAPPPGAG